MSAIISTDRKSPVNTRRFAVAPLTTDNGTTIAYGSVTELEKKLISVKRTPKFNAQTQYASGQQIDGYVVKAGGTLEVQLPALSEDDDVLFFGAVKDTTTLTVKSNKDDVIPYLMAIWSTANSDGTINLHKVLKVKFADDGDTVQTSDDSGAKYQGISITGNYEPLIKTGDDVFSIKGLDVSGADGQAIETAWFTTALGGLPAGNYPVSP